jgi:hypothetical protein
MKSKSTLQWRTATAVRSTPGGGSPIGCNAFLDPCSVSNEPVKAASADVGAQLGRLADHRLARAKHEPSVLRERTGEALESQAFLFRIEV